MEETSEQKPEQDKEITAQNQKSSKKRLIILSATGLALLLAAAAFLLWPKSNSTGHTPSLNTELANQDTISSQNNTEDQLNLVAESDPSEGGKYLVIKEWGVRFELPEALKGDVYYGLRYNVDISFDSGESYPNYADIAYFASKEITEISNGGCGLRDDNDQYGTGVSGGPGVALTKSKIRPKSYANSAIEINGYWFHAVAAGAPPCYASSDGSKEAAFIRSTSKALEGVQSVAIN